MEENFYLYSLHTIPALGPRGIERLLDAFPSPRTMWEANGDELERAGIKREKIPEILFAKRNINIERGRELLEKEGIRVISIKDAEYPALLKTISSPPPLLYIKGKMPESHGLTLAVVGTRMCSAYGREVTEPLVRDLVLSGFTIISGMAKGIDTIAHHTALEHGGKTIAVLGSGIDEKTLYPSQNRHLAKRIASEGSAVLSEFVPGTMPLPEYFPQRNRIIAGLAKGVLVVEAPEKSGALITARFAIDEGREVFAVPGHIFSKNSAGTHRLIQMGAKLVRGSEDILEELHVEGHAISSSASLSSLASPDEKQLMTVFENQEAPIHIDTLAELSGLNINTVSSTLTLMEIDGRIKNLGSGMYTIKR